MSGPIWRIVAAYCPETGEPLYAVDGAFGRTEWRGLVAFDDFLKRAARRCPEAIILAGYYSLGPLGEAVPGHNPGLIKSISGRRFACLDPRGVPCRLGSTLETLI